MGAADMETVVTVDLSTATRKERQFQVVPVPGHFTRGRWKCWDYKDDKTQQQPDSDKDAVTETSTIIITASASTVPDLEPLNQDLINALETTPVKEKETSTIVVTSIAPHPTPIHGTPISVRDELLTEDMVSKLQHTLPDIVATTGAVVVTVPGEIHIQQVSVAQVSSGQPTPLPQVASAPTAGAMVGRPAAEIAEDEK